LKEEPEKMMKTRITMRGIIAGILIFAALAAGTAIALRPVQLALERRMEKIRDDFIGRAEEFCGRKIRYGSMGPSIFGVLDIRNLKLLREDDSVLLEVSRLRLSYSLIELLRGNILDSFSSVTIDRPVLSFDFKKDADLKDRFFSGGSGMKLKDGVPNGAFNIQSLLPDGFSFKIHEGEWELSDPYGRMKLQGVEIDALAGGGRIALQGRWNAAASLTGGKALGSAPAFLGLSSSSAYQASLTGRIIGDFSSDFSGGSASLAISSFSGGDADSGDFFMIRPLAITLLLSDELLEIRKFPDKPGMDFSLAYDLKERSFRARLEAENFPPEDALVFRGPWNEYNPVLSFRISGYADFVMEASGAFDYALDFSGAMPDKTISPLSALAVNASGNRDRLSVENFRADSSLGGLYFRGGVDFNQYEFNPVAPYGHLSLSDFSLRKARHMRQGGISGDFFITTHDRVISLSAENFQAGAVKLSGLDASLYREEQGLFLTAEARSSRNAESHDNMRTSAFSFDCSVDFEPKNMRLNFIIDSFSAGDILSIIEPLAAVPDMPPFLRSAADDILVTTEFFFTTNFS